ncbi:NEL-type E3 ubiquitin ligase domain-containing protein [Herbaspirillum sp. YR522]|uniref:NEL-type E3 ubiquitin ligase domain-containing protein n=1 Tax=Herbaspirillum sp. YR522 TaxID=1144342 RepID=UPI0002D41037|nr:NEL-type E3 ubiquitin ligase domain-containing protein [Herbaspirillum sp. YR522]
MPGESLGDLHAQGAQVPRLPGGAHDDEPSGHTLQRRGSAMQYLWRTGQNSATQIQRLLTGTTARAAHLLPDFVPSLLQRAVLQNIPLVSALLLALARSQRLIPAAPSMMEAEVLRQLTSIQLALVLRLGYLLAPRRLPSLAATPAPPLDEVVQRWFPEKQERWAAFAGEEGAADYARYLHVMTGKLDLIIQSGPVDARAEKAELYRNLLRDVLDPIEVDDGLRAKCFKEAEMRMGNCIDNQLTGLHEQENIIADWALKKRELAPQQLYHELIPLTRKNKLNEEIFNLATSKRNQDECLEYMLSALRTEAIGNIIPTRNYGAIHAGRFQVTPAEAQTIAESILAREREIGIEGDLLMSDAWKSSLRKHYPEEYLPTRMSAQVNAECDRIDAEMEQKSELLAKSMFPEVDHAAPAGAEPGEASSVDKERKEQEQLALGKEINSLFFKRASIESQFWHGVDRTLTNSILQSRQ